MRERRGEIKTARENTLPTLIEADDVHGDLFVSPSVPNTDETITTIAQAAIARGYAYLTIPVGHSDPASRDHSQSL